jgi:S1-C subfamily serine protease
MEGKMTEVIQEMSSGLADIVSSTDTAVVRVEGRRRLPATGIVWSKEGTIVTAHHVVERDKGIQIGLPSGESVPAQIIGRDPTTDLAALRIDEGSLAAPTWVDPEDLRVGHLVLALGRPGKTVQATLGIVSALGEVWRTSAGGQIERYLQTDVVMYPGFSGGPLVNMDGDVVGLNTSALRGVSIALPTPTIRRVVESLLEFGRVRRGFLGVGIQPARLPKQVVKELKQEVGLLIVSLEEGGPAEMAGVLLGDTLLAYNAEPTRHRNELLSKLDPDQVDTKAKLSLLRGGRVKDVEVEVGER